MPSTVVATEQKATQSVAASAYGPKSSVHSANGSYRGVMRESSYQNPGPHGNVYFSRFSIFLKKFYLSFLKVVLTKKVMEFLGVGNS